MIADDQPLGEYPPVTDWQVRNIAYAQIVLFETQLAILLTIDLISISMFGKTFDELSGRPKVWR